MKDKKKIIDQLQKETVFLVFKKKDSEELRTMRGTLKKDLIPEKESSKIKSDRKFSDAVIRVWDLDKNAWRSFIIENLISINGETIQ